MSTAAERMRYRFDVWMSRGTIALMGLLGFATVVFVVILGVITWAILLFVPDEASPSPDAGPFDFMWGALMRTLDPGTMGADGGWVFRVLMLLVTIGGLVIVASLIGIVSGAFDNRIEQLRKGRSRVLERDHTLILGWNSKVFSIIEELAKANVSRGRSHIVIVAQHDKVDMEDRIRAQVRGLGKTSVICRTGDPKSLTDLEIGSPQAARSIILLGPEDAADPDADVIKAALALTSSPAHSGARYHIVGEVANPANLEIAQLVGGDEAKWIVGAELIGRITVQTCRQSGLSNIYQELLDFDRNEIYITDQPSLVGSTYFQAQLAFEASTVIGVARAGGVMMNPAGELMLEPGDQLIVIAEDDSTIDLGERRTVGQEGLTQRERPAPAPERFLVLGENRMLPSMLRELDAYVAPGSVATIVTRDEPGALPTLSRLRATAQQGNATERSTLEALDPTSFDHIIVLADTTIDVQRADSRTLVTLLQLRGIAARNGGDLSVVTEMLDDANRELAESRRPTTSSSATSSSPSPWHRSRRTGCWPTCSTCCSPTRALRSTCTPPRSTSRSGWTSRSPRFSRLPGCAARPRSASVKRR
ncbi:CASTOR/POLLUX-related putative ion channel [Microbacterium sp.]|uniref:CASTOR/POLLUX-related putative ion channel n=1 Tax=Microbacterium sp. TaxID=51671 RepID=UPI003A91AA0E